MELMVIVLMLISTQMILGPPLFRLMKTSQRIADAVEKIARDAESEDR